MSANVGYWLTHHSENIPNKTAIVYGNLRLTYMQLNNRVNRLSHALLDQGVRKGDRVNVLLLNTNEFLETLFACAKIGAIFVPINIRLSAPEVDYIVKDSSSSVFIYDVRLQFIIEELKEKNETHLQFIEVNPGSDRESSPYEKLIGEYPSSETGFELNADDYLMLMYTSGTTGKPKGAILTHGNTLANIMNGLYLLPVTAEDITLTVAPLFHIGGLGISTTQMMYLGGTVVLLDLFTPQSTLEWIEKEKVSTVFMVPSMWQLVMHDSRIEDYDLSSLRLACSGGAPCPLPVIEYFKGKGIPFMEGFGMTETAPIVSILKEEDTIRKIGSVGKPPIHVGVKIVDPTDREVPIGQVGELAIKGPNVTVGYWNKPEATKEALRSGWFYTGDLAKIDDEGYIYIVDRKKDMIISGGENIYPIEVEQVLVRMPNVKEVAVIGIPNEKWGEVIKAYIVLNSPRQTIKLDDIREYCDGRLARFKMPKEIELLDELPRNATGKVLKRALSKPYETEKRV